MAMNCSTVYVGYARVNSSVFSLALKVSRVLAFVVFTVRYYYLREQVLRSVVFVG